MNFCSQPQRHDPSGRFHANFDQHTTAPLKKKGKEFKNKGIEPPRRGIETARKETGQEERPRRGREPSVVSKQTSWERMKQKNNNTVPISRQDSLFAASSQVLTKHESPKKLGRDCSVVQKTRERSRPYEREFKREKSLFRSKNKVVKNQNNVDRQNPLVGMELLFTSEHEVEKLESGNDSYELLKGKTAQELAKELEKTNRLLECERSQRNALRERLDNLDSQLKDLKSPKNESHSAQNRHREDHHFEMAKLAELEEERTKNEKLQEEIQILKAQNNNMNHQMRLLMFQHIPLVSTKFKDIGSVDYSVKEEWGQIGDYKLTRKLGEGHFGTVQLGTNIFTKENSAIKVLNKERLSRFKDMQQIAMEVHVLKHYAHPNIIHLSDVIHAPENIYLVMELCSMDLHTYHSKIGLSEAGAKHVIFGILMALQHLHCNGICHLDLKPENILLTQSADLQNLKHEHIRVCDFGLVNMAKKPESTKKIIKKGYACGTPGFYAPEMVIRKEFEGASADMWSLGAILLETTLGKRKLSLL